MTCNYANRLSAQCSFSSNREKPPCEPLFFLLGTCQNSSTIVDFSLFRMQNLTTVLKTAACLDVKTTLADWQDGEFQNAYFISVDIISVCGSRMKGELVFEKLRH